MYQKAFEVLKDENGKVSFADAVYYDEEMTTEQKIYWLKECVKEGHSEQQKRIDVLEQKLNGHLQNN